MIRQPTTGSSALILVFLILTLTLLNLSPVSAQTFLNNLQQFMHSADWENIIAQAIDNADNKNYVITGTIMPKDLALVKRPILSKLGPNTPVANAFDIQWAKTYFTPDEPKEPSFIDFNVRDVLHTEQNQYVIAGQIRSIDDSGTGQPYQSFLLRTDSVGNPIVLKKYGHIEILKSVVQHSNGEGFAAVGISSKIQDQSSQAAILSVNFDLDPICYKNIIPKFEGKSTLSKSNFFFFCFKFLFSLCQTCEHKRQIHLIPSLLVSWTKSWSIGLILFQLGK